MRLPVLGIPFLPEFRPALRLRGQLLGQATDDQDFQNVFLFGIVCIEYGPERGMRRAATGFLGLNEQPFKLDELRGPPQALRPLQLCAGQRAIAGAARGACQQEMAFAALRPDVEVALQLRPCLGEVAPGERVFRLPPNVDATDLRIDDEIRDAADEAQAGPRDERL